MGPSQSQSLNTDPNIQIYMQLSKQIYIAGQQVQGNIYLNVLNDSQYSDLYLRLQGLQFVNWTQGTVRRRRHYMNKRQTYLDSFLIFNFNQILYKGQYNFPFSFFLPNTLPGSLWLSEKQYIKYSLISFLTKKQQTNDIPNYVTTLNIVEPLRGQFKQLNIEGTLSTTGCCWQQSKTKVSIKCDKNFAITGDLIKIDAEIDNSEGSLLQGCKFILNTHSFKISNKNHSHNAIIYSFDLYKPDDPKIQANTKKNYSITAKIPEDVFRSTAIGNIIARYYTISFVWRGVNLNTFRMHIVVNSRNQKITKPSTIEAPINWNPKTFQRIYFKNMKPYFYSPSSLIPFKNQVGFQQIISNEMNQMKENYGGGPLVYPNNLNRMEITEQDIKIEQFRNN